MHGASARRTDRTVGVYPAAMTPAPVPDDANRTTSDAVDLLGLVAHLEHVAFVRLAGDSTMAPDPGQRLALSRFAARAVERRDRVLARIEQLGGDPLVAMSRYETMLDDFDTRTQPSTWWERLLKGYVSFGVSDDFCRLAAAGLDEQSRALVLEVLGDSSHADLAVQALERACTGDDALTARLALWGRRLVGESLGVVGRLLQQRPGLARLASADDSATTSPATPPTKVLNELTAEHTRRMSRLHLTA